METLMRIATKEEVELQRITLHEALDKIIDKAVAEMDTVAEFRLKVSLLESIEL